MGFLHPAGQKNVIEYHFKEVNFVIILFQLPVNITKQKNIYNSRHIEFTCKISFCNRIEKYKLVDKHCIAKHICSINISKQCIHICRNAILNCILIWLYAVQIGRIYYLYDYVHILEFLIRRNKYFLEFQLKEVLMVFKITSALKLDHQVSFWQKYDNHFF